MQENRLKDYLKILRLNDSINNIYKKLTELELSNQLTSKEYKCFLPLIRNINETTKRTILKYPTRDELIEDFLNNIFELNNFNEDDFNYYIKDIADVNNIKIKRFLEFIDELTLDYFEVTEDDIQSSHGDYIQVNGVNYTWDNVIELLSESNNESLAEYIENELNKEREENEEQVKLSSYLTFMQLCLQIHTFMRYLLSTINVVKIPELKEELIKYKYKMIATYKCLEDYYINDPKNFTECEFFQEELIRYYNVFPEFFSDSNKIYKENINQLLMDYISKDKTDYIDIKDLLHDTLATIYLKTYRSLISNMQDFEKVNCDIKAAISLSNGDYYKSILNNSSYLKPELVLAKKLTN